MKIASWNINSIRARLEQVMAWLRKASPDVVCLQEIKCRDEEFPVSVLEEAGYACVCHGQKTYNGVAILSRGAPLTDVVRGLQDGVEDPQSRVIAATVRGVRVVSIYAPNGQEVGSKAFQYKLEWYRRLRRYLELRCRPNEHLVVCGDFNVAPEPRDVHDPALWEGQTMFTPAERAALAQVMDFGLVDLFRKHHQEGGRYTWWDYRQLAFPRNLGLRIDHVLGTVPVAERCLAAEIDREARKGQKPSDHAPVWVELGAGAQDNPS